MKRNYIYSVTYLAFKNIRNIFFEFVPILIGVAFIISTYSILNSIAISLDHASQEIFENNASLKNIQVFSSSQNLAFSENDISNLKKINFVKSVQGQILVSTFLSLSDNEPDANNFTDSFAKLQINGIQDGENNNYEIGQNIEGNDLIVAKSEYEKMLKSGRYKLGSELALEFNGTSGQKIVEPFIIKDIFDDSKPENGSFKGISFANVDKVKSVYQKINSIEKINNTDKVYSSLTIFVEKIENLPVVAKQVSDLGFQNSYALQQASRISPMASMIRTLGVGIILVMFFGFIFTLVNQYNVILQRRRHEFGILKAIGYNNLEILQSLVVENLMIILLCVFLSITIYIIEYYFAQNFFKSNELEIEIDFISYISGIVFFGIIFILLNTYKILRISNEQIINLLKKR